MKMEKIDWDVIAPRLPRQCQCVDPGCPVHPGVAVCVFQKAPPMLVRVDMHDETGTGFCERCAEDAMASGLFASEEEDR